MNRQKLLKAIPFALEEQLASDIEEQHFAIGEWEGEYVNTAIVKHQIMDRWSACLKQAGIQVDVLLTEVLAVPHEPGIWHLIIKCATERQQSKAILRNGLQSGMALDMDNIVPLLRLSIEAVAEELRPNILKLTVCQELENEAVAQLEATPEISPVQQQRQRLNDTEVQLQDICDKLSIELQVENVDTPFISYLSSHLNEKQIIDLLQGEFSRKEQLEKLFRPWRPAIAIGLSWLVVQLGLMIADYRQLLQEEQELRAQLAGIYLEVFPEEKTVDFPVDMMRSKLQELKKQGSSGSADMLGLLAQAGGILHETESLDIKTMRYKEDVLELDVKIGDLQALDALKNRLSSEANMEVEILSASSKGGIVESRMKIKAGA